MSAASFDSGPCAPRSEGPLGPCAPRSEGPLGLLARAAIAAIAVYQVARAGRPSPCRFWPSCSQYAREAIESHGVWRGGYLAARRVGRCRPRGGHGVDLVPDPLPRAGEAP